MKGLRIELGGKCPDALVLDARRSATPELLSRRETFQLKEAHDHSPMPPATTLAASSDVQRVAARAGACGSSALTLSPRAIWSAVRLLARAPRLLARCSSERVPLIA